MTSRPRAPLDGQPRPLLDRGGLSALVEQRAASGTVN